MRKARFGWWALLLIALASPLCLGTVARADEDAEDEDGAAESRTLEPEEARELAKRLGIASRKRNAADVLPVLEEIAGLSHESFHKPLVKMLKHVSGQVAIIAADRLMEQTPESERDAEKLAKAIWKTGWSDRANRKRYLVQAHALLAANHHEGTALDDRRFREVEKLWRSVIGDPKASNGPALIDVCTYVRNTGDKRLCRHLAEQIDQPICKNPNDPSNPPASWWEGRHWLWVEIKADVIETLEKLTGVYFKSTEEAKAWFEENEREFGFRW